MSARVIVILKNRWNCLHISTQPALKNKKMSILQKATHKQFTMTQHIKSEKHVNRIAIMLSFTWLLISIRFVLTNILEIMSSYTNFEVEEL